MAELKTKPTAKSIDGFLDAVPAERMRDDSYALIKLMQKITGSPPVLWGPTIVGFGKYHYKYASGHEGDACLAAFSPRKGNLVVYIMAAMDNFDELLKKLGKHKATKGCLYIKKLEDIDMGVLEKLIVGSVRHVQKLYPDK